MNEQNAAVLSTCTASNLMVMEEVMPRSGLSMRKSRDFVLEQYKGTLQKTAESQTLGGKMPFSVAGLYFCKGLSTCLAPRAVSSRADVSVIFLVHKLQGVWFCRLALGM